jgi:DNA-binding CsgD family transcriptional regulator
LTSLPGPRSIADRLSEGVRRSFVGRERELDALALAVCAPEPPFSVAYVHGPGGIGKSGLIAAFGSAVAGEARLVVLDGRDIEPTPKGVLAALGDALGAAGGEPTLDDVVGALADHPGRVVLAFDTYESCALIDSWLRRTFVPALPAAVLTIVAGRTSPSSAWLTTPGWQGLFREFELGALPTSDAERMLVARGLDEASARRVNRFARGYPLALELAAAAMRERPDLEIDVAPPPRLVHRLTQAFVAELPPETVEMVEAAATVRRATEPILAALLDRPVRRDDLERLRSLPFVDACPEGAVIHDVVRESLSRDLSQRDPERFARYRWRAWRHFSREAEAARGEGLWHTTADLIYLIANPSVREGFFPQGASGYAVEPVGSGDGPEVAAIAVAAEGPEAAEWIRRWWDRHPEAFRVARAATGDVAAFFLLVEPRDAEPALLAADPVTAAWGRDLAARPVARRERVLFLRRWLSRDSGEAPSPAQAACWIDIKRTYMELRPNLRRLYTALVDLPAYAPSVEPLGFVPLPGADVRLDGVTFRSASLDFGPFSVDGWLSGLIEAELGGAPGGPGRPAPEAAATGLTPRELEVLALLAHGFSNRAIAERLVISEKTAVRHVSNIFGKLGVHTRAEAARIAAEDGLSGPVPTP